MRFASFNIIRNGLSKILDKVVSYIGEIFNRFFNRMLFDDQYILNNNDGLANLKNKIFSILSIFMIFLGAPLLFYGAYMFFIKGYLVLAIVEVIVYIIIAAVITQKSLSVMHRKLAVVLILYFLSILLLITTGVMGAGLVCVLFTLILAGCLLDNNQVYRIVAFNIVIFTAMTALLMYGFFDGTAMESYKYVWFINVITTQVSGIILLFLMNSLFNGLINQTDIIKKSKESLNASEAKHKAMIANISDVIVIVDENGNFKYCSPNMEQSYGWKTEDFSIKPGWEGVHPDERDFIREEFYNLLEKDGFVKTLEARFLCKDGSFKHIEIMAVNLMKDININGILVNFHDVTERKMREEKIQYLNYHDSLTGVYNRIYFDKKKESLDVESKLPLSIIIGDINGLKIINDSLGHAEGDKLLAAIAKILRNCCSKEAIIARTGGDDFSILLPDTSSEAAHEIIKQINLECIEYNKKVSSELYNINISLGYATKTNMDESLDSILKNAEDYLYRRKLLEARSLHSSIIASMKTALSEKSQETEEHAQRLVKLSKAVGQAIGLEEQRFDELELFSTLHDIGKIGIDDQILNKPDKLTAAEWIEMKKHSEVGYRIAMSSPELIPIADYILTHHERWDGSGYPLGLAGESIPLLSRILAVVDAFDAMTEDRPYRKGMSEEAAIKELVKNAGKQFDPEITEIFVEIIRSQDKGMARAQ